MTKFGLAKVEAAKKSGSWEKDPRQEIDLEFPPEFSKALAKNRKARDFFEGLAPSYQQQFVLWIAVAKKPETRARRLKESMALLSKGQKLGMK